jgi:hypothetical protein
MTKPSQDCRHGDTSDPGANAAEPKAACTAQEVGETAALPPEPQPIVPAVAAAVTPNPVIPPTVAQVNVAAAQDPFADLANIRVNQNFATTPGLKDLLTLVPVRRPSKHEFFRVNPAYRLPAAVLINEETSDKETFLLMGGIHSQLPGEFKLVNLRLTVSKQGTIAIWPVVIPGYDGGRPNSWHVSAEDAAQRAETQWIRMRAVKDAGGYQLTAADGAFPQHEPRWPTASFGELLKVAFAGKYIDNLQHPLVQRLLGHG